MAALRDGDAAAARHAFELALAEVQSGEVLERLAEALYLEREYVTSAAHYERAYAAYRREHGWVLIIRAFSEPDAPVREALLREAIAIGRRFGDPDIEFLALAYLGGVLVMTDRVEEGMVLGDEALAALCAGELTELASVDEIFCGLFWACELVNDVS